MAARLARTSPRRCGCRTAWSSGRPAACRWPTLLARSGRTSSRPGADAAGRREAEHFSLHAFGAQFAEVRVDPDLGEIRVSRFVGAFDGGHVLNAKTARSQLIGGITYGIGMALLEETLVDARDRPRSSTPTSPNT